MLSPLEQQHIMRLAGYVTTAALLADKMKRSPAPTTDPKRAQRSLRQAQAALRDYLKDVG